MTFLAAPGLLSSQTAKWQQRLSWFDEELDFTKYKVQIFRFLKYRFFILLHFFSSHFVYQFSGRKSALFFLQGQEGIRAPFSRYVDNNEICGFWRRPMFVGCLKQYFPWKGRLSCARTFLRERFYVVLSRAKGDGYLGYLVWD